MPVSACGGRSNLCLRTEIRQFGLTQFTGLSALLKVNSFVFIFIEVTLDSNICKFQVYV